MYGGLRSVLIVVSGILILVSTTGFKPRTFQRWVEFSPGGVPSIHRSPVVSRRGGSIRIRTEFQGQDSSLKKHIQDAQRELIGGEPETLPERVSDSEVENLLALLKQEAVTGVLRNLISSGPIDFAEAGIVWSDEPNRPQTDSAENKKHAP